MTVSPATTESSPIVLHNGNSASASQKTTTVTVTFANPTVGASFSVEQVGNHLTVSQSGNTITITAKNGNGNQGLFKLTVTPSTGCGSAQFIYVTVAN